MLFAWLLDFNQNSELKSTINLTSWAGLLSHSRKNVCLKPIPLIWFGETERNCLEIHTKCISEQKKTFLRKKRHFWSLFLIWMKIFEILTPWFHPYCYICITAVSRSVVGRHHWRRRWATCWATKWRIQVSLAPIWRPSTTTTPITFKSCRNSTGTKIPSACVLETRWVFTFHGIWMGLDGS